MMLRIWYKREHNHKEQHPFKCKEALSAGNNHSTFNASLSFYEENKCHFPPNNKRRRYIFIEREATV
jgi:hypothetical protein